MNKVAVIVQCRLSSTRFPEKAVKKLGNQSVLGWVLNAMHKVHADYYYVATDEASYETLNPICKEHKFECFAGSLENVLDRFCKLIEKIDADIIVRATADNPFLFYEAAQDSLDLFIEKNSNNPCDYLTYSGLPHGCGVEIINAKSLLKAAEQTDLPYDKEHVGPALYNHKDSFKCEFISAPERFNFPELRATIDTYSDFLRANKVCSFVNQKRLISSENKKDLYTEPFTTEEILEALNSNFVKNPVILCPSVKKGQGTGHLHRCLSIATENKSFVYIPQNSTLTEISEIIPIYKKSGLEEWQIIESLPDETYKPVIVCDDFETSQEDLVLYKNASSLISIDEGSKTTDKFDYLLDIIPSYNIDRKANNTDSSFIKKPENKKNNSEKKSPENFERILICMGGEDPAGFTLKIADQFADYFRNSKVTAIISEKLFNSITESEKKQKNIEFVKTIPELREKLYEFDLVISHYGLTAFEAVYAGCAVILLPTTKLHEKLAEKYGFACLSDEINNEKIAEILKSEKIYPKNFFSSEKKSLSQFVSNLAEGQKLYCPVCQNKFNSDKIISRNITRTYRKCSECSLIYISWTMDEKKEYKKSYFFEEYKKQYGKTYQEDFESIKNQGKNRLDVIKKLIKIDSKTILDIGCAYGPFLSAAKDLKMNPFGTDISTDAVNYVKNELNFPASVAAFPDFNCQKEFEIEQFDVITMWYVIEHFKNLDAVLSKVSQILKKNGIFAFSTPSAEGVSAKSDWDLFFQKSPTDHYSVWEPSEAEKILQKYGFSVEKIVSTGHHPERFPSIKKSNAKKGSLQWKLIDKISHIKKLGDTVEIYCRKIR